MGLISGIIRSRAAKKARKRVKRAGRRARADLALGFEESRGLRDIARARFDPFLSDDPGAALNRLRAASGASGQEAQQEFFTSFEEGPQVEFLRERGLRGIDRAGAAGGNLGSGGRLAALTELAQNFALQSVNQQLNQLGNVATRQQNIARSLSSLDSTDAQNRLNLGINTANIRTGTAAQAAQLRLQQAASLGGAIEGGVSLALGAAGAAGSFFAPAAASSSLFAGSAASNLLTPQQQSFNQGAFPIGPIRGLP